MHNYLQETRLVNYRHPSIQQLIADRRWADLSPVEQVKEIYYFVRDDIPFAYNSADDLPASDILKDGYGQCNTKSTLLMALLSAVNIPNRLHGFTIDKALQKGALDGIYYSLSPQNIVHTWVEVFVENEWYTLEGVILDRPYLASLQRLYRNASDSFCGYGVFTDRFSNPPIDWNLNNTYIQDKGISQDFGLFDRPDDFYQQHQQNLGFVQKLIFKHIVRHRMNRNVARIRNAK